MSHLTSKSIGPLPIASDHSLYIFTLVIFIVSAWVSLMAFFYGLLVSYLQPRVWRSPIVRVIIVAQLMNCFRFIMRIIGSFIDINADFGCRVVIFLNNVFSILPVNLCIYCVVYLELVVIHNISPKKRWPRVVALTLATMCSVIPTSVVLYLPASIVDVDSYCHASRVTNPRQYVYTIFTVAIWVYLPGIIGIFSVAILGFHIIRTRRETQRALQTSRQYYGPAQTVGQPGPPDILQRTLINIIWFPITPILSLWLNVILISVAYYKRRTYLPLEYINSILLGLQSVLIAIALVVNPTVRDALAQYARKRRRRRSEKAILQQPGPASPGACGLPPVHPPSIFGEDELDSGSISEL